MSCYHQLRRDVLWDTFLDRKALWGKWRLLKKGRKAQKATAWGSKAENRGQRPRIGVSFMGGS